MPEYTNERSNADGFSISADGTVMGPDGTIFLPADDPNNPGNLILDTLGNVVDPASGSVIASAGGFEENVTVTRPPTPEPTEMPPPSEEPGNGGEKPEGEEAEQRLWRAVALESLTGQSVKVTRRTSGPRSPRSAVDDGGLVDV